MKNFIIILTKDVINDSTILLEKALNETQLYEIRVCQPCQIHIDSKSILIFDSNSKNEKIQVSEIALVIKRSCGSMLPLALTICKHLSSNNVTILNGVEFIEWSLSKAQQSCGLSQSKFFPRTEIHDVNVVFNDIEVDFPFIVKKSFGARAEGVYLISNPEELGNLIFDLKRVGYKGKIIIQKFIENLKKPDISDYYRINIVGGKPQSAAQFQLLWKQPEGKKYKMLEDDPSIENKPKLLSFFDKDQLTELIESCPYKADMNLVGADIIFDSDNRMYILEFNDGPNVAIVNQLGARYQCGDLSIAEQEEAKECFKFVEAIKMVCIKLAKMKKVTYEEPQAMGFWGKPEVFKAHIKGTIAVVNDPGHQ